MLSDVLIPMLALSDTVDPIEDYLAGLRLLEGMAGGTTGSHVLTQGTSGDRQIIPPVRRAAHGKYL
jgi:hypothetical protein